MTAPTHIAFGTVLYFYLSIMFRIPLSFADAFFSGLVSLLPDIDISSSGIGWRLGFISTRIERRFGHRTMTHSFVGTLGFAVLVTPVLLIDMTTCGLLIAAYWSHVFLDLFNKEGVQIFWPNALWGIFPAKEEHRITVGSSAEHVLMAGLIVLACILYPIASVGLDRTMHWAMATVPGAVEDYIAFSPTHAVYAEIKGIYRKTEQGIEGIYPVIDALDEHTLLIEVEGKSRVVSSKAESHIVPKSVRIRKGKRITHHTQLIDMDGRTFGDLSRLQGTQHRIFGTVKTLSRFDVPTGVTYYHTVTQQGPLLILDYATYADIADIGLENAPLIASSVLVETIVPADSTAKQLSFTNAATSVFPMEIAISAKSDLKVEPGQVIDQGQVLVANADKLRQITLIESELETRRKLRQQKSFDFAVRYRQLEQRLETMQKKEGELQTRLAAYQGSLGFEREIKEVQASIQDVDGQKRKLVGDRKQLAAADASDRLRYEQEITGLLSKKQMLEASALTRAAFDAKLVNLEFTSGKCILYLRRLLADSTKGAQDE